MSNPVLGVVGLGNMGLPVSLRLIRAGYTVLAVDRDPAALLAAKRGGVAPAASPTLLAEKADIIILLLPGSDAVDAVSRQIAAVHPTRRQTKTILDMSSSLPDRTRGLAAELELSGIDLLDAPVSGGVAGAVDGTLTIMAGGRADQVESAMPILGVLGSRVIRLGEVGAGHAAKALNNLLSATHLLATNEAAVIAVKFGIDPTLLMSAINTSSGRSGSSENKLPKFVLPGTFDSGFSSALLLKDLGIAEALAESVGVDAPISRAVRKRWSELNRELEPTADHTEIIKPLEALNDVRIRSQESTAAIGQ